MALDEKICNINLDMSKRWNRQNETSLKAAMSLTSFTTASFAELMAFAALSS
jgi:hypothetical protein